MGESMSRLARQDQSDFVERRRKPRYPDAYPVLVRGVDAAGRDFEAHTILDNLSVSGFYAQMRVKVDEGATLGAEIRPPPDGSMAHLACRGTVVRVEPKDNGLWGIALKFTSRRLIASG
jgi:hypothetical protein